MNQVTVQNNTRIWENPRIKLNSLGIRSEDLLVAIAVLGLFATVVDGNADEREVEVFKREFRKRFLLTRRETSRVIANAIKRITLGEGTNVIDSACDTLNEHLEMNQKIWLMDWIGEVLVADGAVHEGEEIFASYLAQKLHFIGEAEEGEALV